MDIQETRNRILNLAGVEALDVYEISAELGLNVGAVVSEVDAMRSAGLLEESGHRFTATEAGRDQVRRDLTAEVASISPEFRNEQRFALLASAAPQAAKRELVTQFESLLSDEKTALVAAVKQDEKTERAERRADLLRWAADNVEPLCAASDRIAARLIQPGREQRRANRMGLLR